MDSAIVDQPTKCTPIILFTVLLILILPLPSGAQSPSDIQANQTPQPWNISADHLSFNKNTDTYEARGNVSITREGRQLTADEVQFNRKSGEAVAQGNVRLVSGEGWLEATRLDLNLDTEVGRLKKGKLFLKESHFYIFGDEISKTGKDTYQVRQATFTTCDGPDPAWKITGSDLAIRIEGYGTAKNVAFWAKKMPLFYSPYLIFPAKTKRQSGLLMPEIGYSDRKGAEYLQPLYWAINDSSDATFYLQHMSERGERVGLEYRYVLNDRSLGTLMADGFVDSHVDDGKDDNSKLYGYVDDGATDILRPNRDRYWLRAKADQALPADFMARLDLDVVSDQDYLLEFREGLTGFNASDNYFVETFGRGLDDYNDPVRLNRLNLNRLWPYYSLNTDLRWYDNVIARRQEETDTTLQQLPDVTLYGLRQPLYASPFLYELKSEYTYFFSEDGSRGHRGDLYPRLYYPFFLFEGLFVEPSAGLRYTTWYLEHDEEDPLHDEQTFQRTIYDLKMTTRTEFFRVFNLGMDNYDRLKHALIPEVTYTYIPDDDQTDLPTFNESLDRIEPKNLITYSLTNVLTARRPTGMLNGQPAFAYNSFLRLKLENSYDINASHQEDGRPFSDIEADLYITPGRYLWLEADAAWSPYDHVFTNHNTSMNLWDERGDLFSATYRYTRETAPDEDDGIASISFDAQLMIDKSWRLTGGYEYNLYDDKEIESRLGVGYQAQCWGVDLEQVVGETSRSYYLVFHLKGLGSIGR